jgi:lysophospholipase L1-like esterase
MRLPHRIVPVLAAAALLAITQWSGSPTTAPDHARSGFTATDGAIRIMPLGDSNTTGTVGGAYRSDLWQLLTSDGIAVDFVGSNTGGPTPLPDKNHEGHGGWTIAQIDQNATAWMQTCQPDLVLLQIGTNDMYTDASAAGAPARLATLLDKILAAAPRAHVMVASIPPIDNAGHQHRAEVFNAAVPGIAAARDRVTYVDVYDAVEQPYDFGDSRHPTWGGYSKIALRWYGAITGDTPRRYEPEQTLNATVTSARKVAVASASGGIKVGSIDYPDSAVEFHVVTGSPGTYRLHIRGSATSACTHNLSVNGAAPVTVSYPALGWEQWSAVRADVALNAGLNTLRFTKGTCYAEIDALDVGTKPLPPPPPPPTASSTN